MKRLHRMILRSWPGPFVAAFGTLMFLLLMQFLINYLPELVGRGLPAGAVLELIAYSLAYMVTLAVPMAVLLATVLAFARLAETQAYAVMRSAGISLLGVAWPVVLLGLALVGAMVHFNNEVLPEANFRMKGLWQDIRQSKPGFQLEPGVFFEGVEGYAIRAERIDAGSSELGGVLIFDYADGTSRATIAAERGEIESRQEGLELTLHDGEIHRARTVRDESGRAERYERIAFERHRLRLDLSELTFERTGPETTTRSDRTMPTRQMVALVDSLEAGSRERRAELRRSLPRLGHYGGPEAAPPPRGPAGLPDSLALLAGLARGPAPPADTASAPAAGRAALAGLGAEARRDAYDLAAQRVRAVKAELSSAHNSLRWERQRANRYRVEIYKKYSMAVACLVFVLAGIPLGLAVRRGGLGLIATLALAIFLFYWITLVQGEKLADVGLLAPWTGMWTANIVVGALALYLFLREQRDPAHRDPLRRLLARLRRGQEQE